MLAKVADSPMNWAVAVWSHIHLVMHLAGTGKDGTREAQKLHQAENRGLITADEGLGEQKDLCALTCLLKRAS